jgi:hypothetical protein
MNESHKQEIKLITKQLQPIASVPTINLTHQQTTEQKKRRLIKSIREQLQQTTLPPQLKASLFSPKDRN